MAYQGYLIKVGEYKIPYEFINAETYKAHKSIQDVDSYRDANGKLHRQALAHVPCKVEFETPPNLTSLAFTSLMEKIKENYIIAEERKAVVTSFIPEENDYMIQEMYMPDITPTIKSLLNDEIYYSPIRLAFIGY